MNATILPRLADALRRLGMDVGIHCATLEVGKTTVAYYYGTQIVSARTIGVAELGTVPDLATLAKLIETLREMNGEVGR